MNTRDASTATPRTYREVMDALANALHRAMDWNWLDDDARPSHVGDICGAAIAAYDAFLAEGSASEEAVYQIRSLSGSWVEVSKTFYELCAGDRRILYTRPQPAQGEPEPAESLRYVQWTEAGGVRVDLDSFFKSDAGKAALARFEASAHGEHEQRSCEGSERMSAKAIEILRNTRNDILSARVIGGIAAVDDASICRWSNSLLIAEARIEDAVREHNAALRTLLATAERPSCGQDARDAAFTKFAGDKGLDTTVAFRRTLFMAGWDAAIAAQQRQGGAP